MLATRFQNLPVPPRARRLTLDTEATLADYRALAEHHYRAGKPATATRVLAYRDPTDGLASRVAALNPATQPELRPSQEPTGVNKPTQIFTNDAPGEHTKAPTKPPPVAVLVESLPSLSCKMRDHALSHRFGTHLPIPARAVLLNREVRCISRVVVDPRWRGQGLAVALVRHALATATTPITEALAAMGKVSPFFERAGMTAYPRPTHAYDDRLRAALVHLGLDPAVPDPDEAAAAINRLDAILHDWLRKELRLWFAKNGGRRQPARATAELPTILRVAQHRLHSEPVYYAAVHRA